MDSQDSTAAPPPQPQPQQHHLHQQSFLQHHHHQQQPFPATMLMSPPHHHSPYQIPTPNAATNLMQQHNPQNPNSQRFPFSSIVTSPGPVLPTPKLMDFSDSGGGGVAPPSPNNGGGGAGYSVEPAKKKRGRPRKYSPDHAAGSGIALGLSTTPATATTTQISGPTESTGAIVPVSSEGPVKKHRGRPPGSGKKQLDALGAAGIGFTPHVITVKPGEDIASKIMAFSQEGPRTVCILSANGAICNVTLKQPAASGGSVSYEGRFEIISLSGSYLMSESNGTRSRSGGLSVSLAGSDGRVLGGGVSGMLVAASPVQVVVGSFIADGKKPKASSPAATPAAPNMLNFANPIGASPPSPSHGASSDSSDENGGSPVIDRSSGGPFTQPMQNMQMFSNMGWANSTTKMHPN